MPAGSWGRPWDAWRAAEVRGPLPPVLTSPAPAAPEEDELQRHAPGHRGVAPGEAEGPEDTVHRAQRQWQEHERVSGEAGRAQGLAVHAWGRGGAQPLCSLTPLFSPQEHHYQVKPTSLLIPSRL